MGNPRHGLQVEHPHAISVVADCVASPANEAPDSLAVLAFLSQEIMGRMGKDFLGKMPLELMERFCIATVENNDPTGELLHKLVINFMTAYSNQDTNAEALKAFDFLDYLADQQG